MQGGGNRLRVGEWSTLEITTSGWFWCCASGSGAVYRRPLTPRPFAPLRTDGLGRERQVFDFTGADAEGRTPGPLITNF